MEILEVAQPQELAQERGKHGQGGQMPAAIHIHLLDTVQLHHIQDLSDIFHGIAKIFSFLQHKGMEAFLCSTYLERTFWASRSSSASSTVCRGPTCGMSIKFLSAGKSPVTAHLESQLGKGHRQSISSMGETSKLQFKVPAYNPRTESSSNCKSGFLLMLFVL